MKTAEILGMKIGQFARMEKERSRKYGKERNGQ